MSSPASDSREENFLENYFLHLSQFAFDRAKELADKDKGGTATCWGTLLQCFSQLATAEKMYMTLTFLGQKRFPGIGRARENLRNIYQFLIQEFKRLDSSGHMDTTPGTVPPSDLEILLAHLCGQLYHYLTARHKMMDLYEQMSAMANHKNVSFVDLSTIASEIIEAHRRGFHHPLLSPVKSAFSLECSILSYLLEAQVLISEWQFLPAVLQLHQANSRLASWAVLASVKDSKKGFSQSKSSTVPALYLWLLKFKGLLVSKFSLYFYDVLSKQSSSVEMKTLTAKASEDFVAKMITFQKKSDATSVCLVFDTTGVRDKFTGPGYHHPDKFVEPPRGVDSFPAIFSYPGDRPTNHWPNVLMRINEKDVAETGDKISCFYDMKAHSTYFISRVDARVSLVVIFETKKSEKDSYVNNFMSDFGSHLRCTKILSSLKPGSKT
ncbi:KICSTOR complex protein C12orf66 homolog isoform X2 [Gigantopelta aegis]|uniref:KICSTOR complex protein C12orf66 homolog isoform X2 n=1 Tax=Gigantopelta aegis TaxID=1735272 RepID=UPI001B88C690|nr:KICSTOR complex protein C12orf66 homolog isoform X2 [Gigantopelta aegis]